MKHIKLCLSYLFKSGWYVWLMWLLPAVFVGFCCQPFKIIAFVNKYPKQTITNFGSMLSLMMPNWLGIIFAVLGIVLVSIAISMAIGQMESHMRSGKLNFKEMFSYVNNNILVTLVNVVLMVVINFILTFLLCCILFLFQIVFSGLNTVPTVFNVVFAIVFCAFHLVLNMFVVTIFSINIPNMISNGYSLKEAIPSSVSLIGSSAVKLALAYLIPFAITIPFVSLLANTAFVGLAHSICALITLSYYSVISMTSYFELSNTSRYDNRKYYNYNR